MAKETFNSAIYLIIKDENNNILLQRRQETKLWPNFLALPAGHVDKGEDVYDAAIREAKEELDITIKREDLVNPFITNRLNRSLIPYFDVYFEVKKYTGNIKINEKDKCSELVWSPINNLPNDMITYEKEAIYDYLGNKYFSVIYANNEETISKKLTK